MGTKINKKAIVARFRQEEQSLIDSGALNCRSRYTLVSVLNYPVDPAQPTFVFKIPGELIPELSNNKRRVTVYFSIDTKKGVIVLDTKPSPNSASGRIAAKRSGAVYVLIPHKIVNSLQIKNTDLFSLYFNLKQKRIELIPFEIASPYITEIVTTRKAYKGSPPRESVIELTHTTSK